VNASDVLRYGQRTVHAALDGLTDDEWEMPGVCGVWSVSNIIAHLASYEVVLVDVLAALTDGRSTPRLDQFLELGPAYNDRAVDERRDFTGRQVLDEFDTAHRATLDLIAALPAERLRQPGLIPWYGDDYAVDDLIVYQYYGHKREHTAQIEAFRDRPRVDPRE
jgi:uncharacterized protein (TIGR03083 family)